MKFSKDHKQWICILFILAIVLSGTCSGISQGNVFFVRQNISTEVKITSLQGREDISHDQNQSEDSSSSKYQVTHTFFAKEDCRIEDTSARTLRKINSVCEEKRGHRGRSESPCAYPGRYISKVLKSIQDQYIGKTRSIETINKLIISYIHQKDGAKGIGLFF